MLDPASLKEEMSEEVFQAALRFKDYARALLDALEERND